MATRTEHRKDWQQKDKIELLNYAFLHTLGLSEYSFHPVSDPDFANLEIAESKDSYGVVYLGEWKNKLPHGNGVLTSNTCKYIGQFKQGLKHFHGREILSHEVYEGTFENGNRKGEGVLYSKEATKTGLFDGDLVDGEIVYSNHDCYKGKLQDGKYTGSGNVFE